MQQPWEVVQVGDMMSLVTGKGTDTELRGLSESFHGRALWHSSLSNCFVRPTSDTGVPKFEFHFPPLSFC